MQLPSSRRPVKAAWVVVLMLAVYATLLQAQKNKNKNTQKDKNAQNEQTALSAPVKSSAGRVLPWTTATPVEYDCNRKTFFFNRVLSILIDSPDDELGCLPVSTAVILDANRVLTSYSPFRKLVQDFSIISTLTLYTQTSNSFNNDQCRSTSLLHDVWSGRQVTFSPDEDDSAPKKSWHGQWHDQQSPIHDLMVLRTNPALNKNMKFSNLEEHDITLGTADQLFIMPIAKPGDRIEYPLRFAQMNVDGDRQLQTYDFVNTDDIIVNCDSYIPKIFGLFICLRNILELRTLASGAVLVSNQTVFGIGSFAYSRDDLGLLVFTDVRPYYDLIMNAMTEEDTL